MLSKPIAACFAVVLSLTFALGCGGGNAGGGGDGGGGSGGDGLDAGTGKVDGGVGLSGDGAGGGAGPGDSSGGGGGEGGSSGWGSPGEAGAMGDAGARGDAGSLPASGTSVTACQTLSTAAAPYVLQNDVTAAGTCFSVTADDVTLNLNGHTVSYGTASQSSEVVSGIMMGECWESAWGSTISASSGAACGTFQNFTVGNGTIKQGGGTLQSGSHVIRAGGNGSLASGPNVFGITSSWSAPYSQFLSTDYGNGAVAGAAVIHDNVLTDGTSAPCAAIACRDELQSASIRLSGAIATTKPAQIYNNTINGGPQGAIECDAPGCLVHDNLLNPGNPDISMSNDFAIWCWASCDYHDNVILVPLTASSQGRGIEIGAIETSTKGANVHNNTISVLEKPNNAEYGGCPLGGAYGIQFDDNPTGATAQDNAVTAVADSCWGTALRLTDTEAITNVSTNNTYDAIRTAGSPACGYIGGGTGPGCAHAVALDGPTGFTSRSDTFQGDSDALFFDWDGASGVTFVAPKFLKGATNPSPDFHTFVFRNGGTPVGDIHIQDATFGSGTSATDTDLPAQGGNNLAASLTIDWSQTVTVTKSGGTPVAGASVAFTDALGHASSGTTDASGVAVVVVTQYRLNNDKGANGVEDHNPYVRAVSSAGCITGTTSNLAVTATGAAKVTLGGC
jgi:hypothetical protein